MHLPTMAAPMLDTKAATMAHTYWLTYAELADHDAGFRICGICGGG